MKTKLLNILRNTEEYVSGQELCHIFGVSRTAIWKCINQLKEEGYEFEAIQNKGYKIKAYPDSITSWEVESRIIPSSLIKKVYSYDKVDSTNQRAKRIAEEIDNSGILVIAETQTGGKGRRGRQWESPSGTGIWMSIALKPDIEPFRANMLTLVAGLAVCKGIAKSTNLESFIKWPNDIVIHGKKVCGILTEMTAESDYIDYVVTGIGINVNIDEFPDEIRQVATSIKIEKGTAVSRAELVEHIIDEYEKYYKVFIKTSDMRLLMEEYNAHLINLNKEVKILQGKNTFVATALGINHNGELIVKGQDGKKQAIVSGEVSVRGVYGYV